VTCATGYAGTAPTCVACTTGCLACTAVLATACTSCKVTYFFNTLTGGCVTVCPATAYHRESLQLCVECVAPCLACTVTKCLSCRISSDILFNGLCITTCPPPYYSNGVNCVTDCSPNAWGNSNTQACQPCPASCSICPQGQCVQCSAGFLSGGVCLTACPASTFPSASTCVLCYYTCGSCTAGFETNCLSCAASYYLAGPAPTVCLSGCPFNSYLDTATTLCVTCLPSCTTCANSPATCTSCQPTEFYFLNKSSCLADCGVGRPINLGNRSCWDCQQGLVPFEDRCVSCHPTCGSCTGPEFDQCIICQPGRVIAQHVCRCGNHQ
jgi:hypothetical protein